MKRARRASCRSFTSIVVTRNSVKDRTFRPCDECEVRLRDLVGMEHRLTADVGCRNTLNHAVPQTAAEYLPGLGSRGTFVSSFSTGHPLYNSSCININISLKIG
jgi:hypothetical protein